MEEIWKDIPGYEGLYKVSNLGNVKSVSPRSRLNNCQQTELIMKQILSSSGYYHVQLYKPGCKASTKLTHILVATSFVENKGNKPQVNHKDGNKTNNVFTNLEWVSRSDNIKHAYQNNLLSSPMKGRYGEAHPTSKAVNQFSLEGSFIRSWGSISDAARAYNTDPRNICECLSGRNKTCKGFVWKYKE